LEDISDPVIQAQRAFQSADAVLIGAGAGMGVDSGLPDFRGREGFWRAYPAIAKLGITFEGIANSAWFQEDPALAWAFYGHRLNLYRSTEPHDGFRQLLRAAKAKPQGYFVFTSNVDGQFQKAGYSVNRIVECHGSIHHFQCTRPCSEEIWPADAQPIDLDETAFRAREPLPRCQQCGELARPNVLMFHDRGWLEHREEEQERKFTEWLEKLAISGARLAIVELGAGTAIASVRYVCERAARIHEGTLIRINPREYAVPPGHIGLPLGALHAIGRILNR
jgi:NAD-dependent SIR2 family protein deacetylase